MNKNEIFINITDLCETIINEVLFNPNFLKEAVSENLKKKYNEIQKLILDNINSSFEFSVLQEILRSALKILTEITVKYSEIESVEYKFTTNHIFENYSDLLVNVIPVSENEKVLITYDGVLPSKSNENLEMLATAKLLDLVQKITIFEIINQYNQNVIYKFYQEFYTIQKINLSPKGKEYRDIVAFKLFYLKCSLLVRDTISSNKHINPIKLTFKDKLRTLDTEDNNFSEVNLIKKVIGHYFDWEDSKEWKENLNLGINKLSKSSEINSFTYFHEKCKFIKDGKESQTTDGKLKSLDSLFNQVYNSTLIYKNKLLVYIKNNQFSLEISSIQEESDYSISRINKLKASYLSLSKLNNDFGKENYFHHHRFSKFLFDTIEGNLSGEIKIDFKNTYLLELAVDSLINANKSLTWMKDYGYNILNVPFDECQFELNLNGKKRHVNVFQGFIVPQDYDWILRNEIEPLNTKAKLIEFQVISYNKFRLIEESVENTKKENTDIIKKSEEQQLKTASEFNEKIASSTVRNVEILSIFGALSYFVTSSVSIFNSDKITIPQHLSYIMIMGGILLLFIALTKIIVSEKWEFKSSLVFVIVLSLGFISAPLYLMYKNTEEPKTETTTTIKEEYKSEKRTEKSVPVINQSDSSR